MSQQFENSARRIVWLSIFIAIGLIVFIFESYIPRPLPWLKPGLANIATLTVLYIWGCKSAMIMVIFRVFLGSIIMGTFLNPAFILALGGGMMATLAMAGVKRLASDRFSIFGISIVGAVTHNLVQLILVEWLIVRQIEIFYLIPALILSALFTGMLVAFISHHVLEAMKKHIALKMEI